MRVEKLAKIFLEEMEADGWGTIEPEWFEPMDAEDIALAEDEHNEEAEFHLAWQKLLERVAKRI